MTRNAPRYSHQVPHPVQYYVGGYFIVSSPTAMVMWPSSLPRVTICVIRQRHGMYFPLPNPNFPRQCKDPKSYSMKRGWTTSYKQTRPKQRHSMIIGQEERNREDGFVARVPPLHTHLNHQSFTTWILMGLAYHRDPRIYFERFILILEVDPWAWHDVTSKCYSCATKQRTEPPAYIYGTIPSIYLAKLKSSRFQPCSIPTTRYNYRDNVGRRMAGNGTASRRSWESN